MPVTTIDGRLLTRSQREVLRAKDQNVLVSGGFGSGKTTALALKAIQLMTANKGVPGLILAASWGTLWSTTVRRLIQTLRQCGYSARVRDRGGQCYLAVDRLAPIFLRSAKREETFDGLDVGWVLGDEARHWPRRSYYVALGRRRVPCPLPQMAMFSTPAMNWLGEEFNSGKENRRLIIAPTKHNEKNLAPGFIDNLRLSYSPRLQKAVIDGLFTVLEGAVFEEFDPATDSPWLVDYDARKFPERTTYLAVDPGYRRSAWLFIHKISDMEWIVFDELMLDETSDMAAVERVNSKNYRIDEIWTDPAADNTQSVMAFDTIQALNMIKTRSRNPICTIVNPWRSIPFGVDKLRVMIGGEGLPMRLKFARSLVAQEHGKPRGIIKDLSALRYPEVKDGRPVTDLPLKDGMTDHSTDALRYWTVGMFLTSSLRKLDPVLAKDSAPGWRKAS